ncbi:UNVERIFIED_ORG: hypothetical protein J2Y78_004205 [Buttiauxella agrestis ATCC 33320]|jgi:hypothetical protein
MTSQRILNKANVFPPFDSLILREFEAQFIRYINNPFGLGL